MPLIYPARIERVADDEFLVRFPDLPSALTGAGTYAEALELAADCLTVALEYYADIGEAPPPPGPVGPGEVAVKSLSD